MFPTFLQLFFRLDTTYTLESVCFLNPILNCKSSLIRGKTSGPLRNFGTFQWTAGMKGLTYLLINALDKKIPFIFGMRGSLAASLDHSIDKRVGWICDLFGTDESGRSLVGRFLKRTNPGGRRAGHIIIGLNSKLIDPSRIEIYINNQRITHDELGTFIREFSQQFASELKDNKTETRCPSLCANNFHSFSELIDFNNS